MSKHQTLAHCQQFCQSHLVLQLNEDERIDGYEEVSQLCYATVLGLEGVPGIQPICIKTVTNSLSDLENQIGASNTLQWDKAEYMAWFKDNILGFK